jgi:protein SCO1/2
MNHASSSARSLPIVLVLIAAFASGLGLWLGSRQFTPETPPPLIAALLYPEPREVPDFQLTQTQGKPYGKDDWRGHWTILFFGYTTCPDVCPTTLAVFKHVWSELTQLHLDQQLRIDFISIDPQRDTPEQLAGYVAYFSPDFRAATGSDDDLNRLTRALGLVYSRTIGSNGEVQIDHSASAAIINPQAELIGLFRPPLTAEPILADLKTLLNGAN